MAKINEIKGKAKEMVVEAKAWVIDHKFELAFYGTAAGVLVGGIVLGRHNSKKYMKAWRAAKEAYENGQLEQDFGPYKVVRFFEPKTDEFIGETMCHENYAKAILDVK